MTDNDTAANREAPRMDCLYWAKRSFWYGADGQELELDRGQVFKLQGLPNDALLVDLAGYVGRVAEGAAFYTCRVCGLEFIDQAMRDAHGKKRHEEDMQQASLPSRRDGESETDYLNRLDEWAKLRGAAEDAKDEKRAKREDEQAPIDFTKTQASREATT